MASRLSVPAPTLGRVPRLVAPAALLTIAVATAAVAVGTLASERAPGQADAAVDGVYPRLRPVVDLARPGGRGVDTGVGVYPALRSTTGLSIPTTDAVEEARRFAAGRRGRISFAAADASGGLAGQALGRRYASASLSKAILLVAYLDQVERNGRGLSEADVERLDDMVRVSDNASASATLRRLEPGALERIARRAGLRSFEGGSDWGNFQVTAADQVRFFLALDRLLPAARRNRYARQLLSSVVPAHSWGIPAAARPRWRVYFKGGWRPDEEGEIVHQAALLERGDRKLALAILTDGNPNQRYGEQTVQGIAARLLGAEGSRK